MYSKFDLKISDSFYKNNINEYLESGKKIYDKHEKEAKKCLKEFIYDNGHIDGTAMKDNWFQMEDVDIFISHSHQDLDEVKAFAGWLYDEFAVTAFIDSCAWGYCDELIKEIDNKYCKNDDKGTYDYNLRNYTTSHVHMMLSTALAEMIDRTECIMFYNTPNSVILSENVENIKKSKDRVTSSPWIYHELAMTSLVGRKVPNRKFVQDKTFLEHKIYAEKDINIEHNLDKYLNKMISLGPNDLELWKKYIRVNNRDGNSKHPLDVLYSLPVIKTANK